MQNVTTQRSRKFVAHLQQNHTAYRASRHAFFIGKCLLPFECEHPLHAANVVFPVWAKNTKYLPLSVSERGYISSTEKSNHMFLVLIYLSLISWVNVNL